MRSSRNYIIAILLLLLGIHRAAAQTYTADSLLQVLRDHPTRDTFYVNRLMDLIEFRAPGRPYRDSLLKLATRLSDSLNYTAGRVYAMSLRAFRVNDKREGLKLSTEAVRAARATADKSIISLALYNLAYFEILSPDTANILPLLRESLDLATATGDPYLQALVEYAFTVYYINVNINYPVALEHAFRSLPMLESLRPHTVTAELLRNIGDVYDIIGDSATAIQYLHRALTLAKAMHENETAGRMLNDIGEIYRMAANYPPAISYYRDALPFMRNRINVSIVENNLADSYSHMGRDSLALSYSFAALNDARAAADSFGLPSIYCVLGRTHFHAGHKDSALFYARIGYQLSVQQSNLEWQRDNEEVLSGIFAAQHKNDSAFHYYTRFIADRDSLNNQQVIKKARYSQYNYDLGKKQSEIDLLNKDKQLQREQANRQRAALTAALIGLGLIVALLVIIVRNNRQRRRAFALLQQQKQDIQGQRDQTAQALRELRQTQQQLIHSEKMAALGELTAGVAHEIQNPLNFVNNFAELDIELLDELRNGPLQLLTGPALNEATTLIADISENLSKINYHGKRAESIVKGMLMHSRSGAGKKEPTDLNALGDEALRLAYHGFRAKDKSFNAKLETQFDPAVGLVDIVPQDIGRVLLNLLTNAFYAVAEKQKHAAPGYGPIVNFTSRRDTLDASTPTALLIIRDNGSGIPQHVLEKIYQPFFSTKPTGEGTGLGLSMSYDIITKGHSGMIEVESQEGVYTQFTIRLPA